MGQSCGVCMNNQQEEKVNIIQNPIEKEHYQSVPVVVDAHYGRNSLKLQEKQEEDNISTPVKIENFIYESQTKMEQKPKPIQEQKISMKDFKLLFVIVQKKIYYKTLGKGAFGKVVLAQYLKTKELFAIKIIKKSQVAQDKHKNYTMNEKYILQNISNPFIVQLHFAFQSNQKLYLVMDFQQGGELYFHLRKAFKFPENIVCFVAAELILALEALHSKGIIYRDLKPENILINRDGHIKVADFGLAKINIQQHQMTHSIVGTPEYLAPEIYLQNEHSHMCDWWSLGALIYEMLTGAPPFYSRDKTLMFRNRQEKPIEVKPWFSQEATQIIQSLLNNNPSERLGANGVNEIKQSSFFKNIDWDALYRKEVISPIVLNFSSSRDLKYFDKVFIQEPVRDSPVYQIENDTIDDFSGYSYDKEYLVKE